MFPEKFLKKKPIVATPRVMFKIFVFFATACWVALTVAQYSPVNQYNFDGNLEDSVGSTYAFLFPRKFFFA